MQQELIDKLNKFFLDPDWPLVENILKEYIEPLKLIKNIDLKQDSAAVHAELKANLVASEALEKFLSDVGMLRNKREHKQDFK